MPASAYVEETPEVELPHFFTSPDRNDKIIMLGIGISMIYGFCLRPFKLALLGHPWVLCAVNGSVLGLILSGNAIHQHHESMWMMLVPVLLAFLGVFKFMPLWWAIGRKWGDEYLEWTMPKNSRVLKVIRRYEGRGKSYDFMLLCAAHFPFSPIPSTLVNLFIGNARVPWYHMVWMNLLPISAAATFYTWLGYEHGKGVADVIEKISHQMMYVGFITTAIIMFGVFKANKSKMANIKK